MTGLQGPAGYRQGTIDRVGASVGANGIALGRLRKGSNDRATLEWIAQDYVAHLKHHLNQILGKTFETDYGK